MQSGVTIIRGLVHIDALLGQQHRHHLTVAILTRNEKWRGNHVPGLVHIDPSLASSIDTTSQWPSLAMKSGVAPRPWPGSHRRLPWPAASTPSHSGPFPLAMKSGVAPRIHGLVHVDALLGQQHRHHLTVAILTRNEKWCGTTLSAWFTSTPSLASSIDTTSQWPF